MNLRAILAALFLVASRSAVFAQPDPLQKLADDFWKWRAANAPFSGDDVNRMDRPGGARDWSRASIEKRGADLKEFDERWRGINLKDWTIPQQVDYRLMGSALARVHWELERNPRWKRDPNFYLDQTLTAVAEALTVPAPYNESQSREILTRIENIPAILKAAQANLERPPAPFANVAIQALADVRTHLNQTAGALQSQTSLKQGELKAAADRAGQALEDFKAYLQKLLPSLPQETALGREAYLFFLKNVGLYPYSPEEMLAMGRQEWARAVTFESYERHRNKTVPQGRMFATTDEEIQSGTREETNIRNFLKNHSILTVPDWMQHWTLRPTPEHLRVFGFTETDDFTSPSRLKENGIRYIPAPSEELGYFLLATAYDTRPLCVHEGIPGHYFQLCLSWKHEDSIRRHYYDSGANEGIGFYAEEMMLQAGLFDESPHTREIIYNFMRLRALRVEVDVKLALGEFTLDQAAKYLQEKVPMDPTTARGEAIAFATGPGQALTYQIGKLQITKLLAELRMKEGAAFDLLAFHNFLWKNGNVPISLQRWELLGDKNEVP